MKKIIALVAVLLTTACLGGTTRPAKIYSLNSISDSSVFFKSAKLVIGVEEVKMPIYLDKPQIVTREPNQVEMNISEYNRWSEPLGAAMQRAIADDMAVYMPNALVKPTSFRREGFDYIVWVEVNRFDGSFGKTVELSAWWSVYTANGKLMFRGKSELSRPLGKTYDDLALQYGDIVSELARQISAKSAKLAK